MAKTTSKWLKLTSKWLYFPQFKVNLAVFPQFDVNLAVLCCILPVFDRICRYWPVFDRICRYWASIWLHWPVLYRYWPYHTGTGHTPYPPPHTPYHGTPHTPPPHGPPVHTGVTGSATSSRVVHQASFGLNTKCHADILVAIFGNVFKSDIFRGVFHPDY